MLLTPEQRRSSTSGAYRRGAEAGAKVKVVLILALRDSHNQQEERTCYSGGEWRGAAFRPGLTDHKEEVFRLPEWQALSCARRQLLRDHVSLKLVPINQLDKRRN